MNAGELVNRALERVGEDPIAPAFYSRAEALAVVNEGQRLFVLLTLCLEQTASLPLVAHQTWYSVPGVLSDFLLPLRVRRAGGEKVSPVRVTDLDALDRQWQLSENAATARYACVGFGLLAVHPRPPAAANLTLTYARVPIALVADGDVPEIPEEYHQALIDYAVPRLRVKEGGQEFAKSIPLFDRFLESSTKLANYIRARNLAQRYDRVPFELQAADRSRLLGAMQNRPKPVLLDIPESRTKGDQQE